MGPGGLLKDRAVLLASHSTSCAEKADRVLLLGAADAADQMPLESRCLFQGTWPALCAEKELLQLIGQADVQTSVEREQKSLEVLDLQKLEVSKPKGAPCSACRRGRARNDEEGRSQWQHLMAFDPHVLAVCRRSVAGFEGASRLHQDCLSSPCSS